MDSRGRPTNSALASPAKEKSKTLGSLKAEKSAMSATSSPGKVASGGPARPQSLRFSSTTELPGAPLSPSPALSATVASFPVDDDSTAPAKVEAFSDLPNTPSSGPLSLTTSNVDSSSSSGNVRVCVRFRPQNTVEKDCGGFWIVEGDEKQIKVKDPQIFQPQTFSFDRVFMPEATQQSVYEVVGRPLVSDVLNGYNCSLMAYGQTGSGKTHTMMGEEGDQQGIIPRIIEDVFNCMESAPPSIEFTIRVSYVEIYLERICDLLNPENTDLKVREDVVRGLYLEGVEEVYVASREEIRELMSRGSANRSVASTRMNADSSRSHSVFIITTEQNDGSLGVKKCGRMYLVDLAGSETVSKTNASGQTLQEAKMINKSLSALGNVIKALTERQSHIPYRDSKLTRLLQDALGGNSKTSLIIACSGSSYNVTETLSTLRFGTRAKSIRNKPRVNQERSLEEYKRLLEAAAAKEKDLESIIRRLEDQVQDLLKRTKMRSPTKGSSDAHASRNKTSRMQELGPEPEDEEEEEEEAEDGPGVADLLAAELVTVVNVLQPLATDIKDELSGGEDDRLCSEVEGLLKHLEDAVSTKTAPGLSSGILRMFQVLKEVLDDKTRALRKASSAMQSLESSVAEKDGLLAEREAALAAKDSAMAGLTTQAQDLRAANERTAEQLREATAQANEESQRAQLAEERVKELEAALVRKDYELKEQALVTEQLRSTLDTIMVTVPTASIVTSMVSTPSSPRHADAKQGFAQDGGEGASGETPAKSQKDRDLENDLRDLMARYLDMRVKLEEEKASVEQLKEVLNDLQSEEAGPSSNKEAKMAQTVVDLRRALDRKGIELQEKGVLVQSLQTNRATMEAQLANRDDHIRHLEAMVNDLQGRIRDKVVTSHKQQRAAWEAAPSTNLQDDVAPRKASNPSVLPAAPKAAAEDDEDDDGNHSDSDDSVDTGYQLPSRPKSMSSAAMSSAARDNMHFRPPLSGRTGLSSTSWLASPSGSVEAGIDWVSNLWGKASKDAAGAGGGNNNNHRSTTSGMIRKVIRGRGRSKEGEEDK